MLNFGDVRNMFSIDLRLDQMYCLFLLIFGVFCDDNVEGVLDEAYYVSAAELVIEIPDDLIIAEVLPTIFTSSLWKRLWSVIAISGLIG